MSHQPNTIFTKHAQRVGVMERNWGATILVVTVVCILFAIVSAIIANGKMYTPGALIVIPLTYLFRKQGYDEVTFYLRYHGFDNFSWCVSLPGKPDLQGSVDEYSYWYVPNNKADGKAPFQLCFEIISNGQTTYFIEDLVSNNPPAGWTESDARIAPVRGIYLMSGLQELAFKIDKESGNADGAVTQ